MQKTSGFAISILALAAASVGAYEAIPVPKNVRVSRSEPRKVVWATLSKKEKSLATHLIAAAKAGEPIVYFQSHRHAGLIQNLLAQSLKSAAIKDTKALLGNAFPEYLAYAAKFREQFGPYPDNRKMVMKEVTGAQLAALFAKHQAQAEKTAVAESIRLMTDPDFEVISQPEDTEGTHLEIAGGNLYSSGLSGKDVARALKQGLKSNLNCRIARRADGKIECQVLALSNPNLDPTVKLALSNVVAELAKALPFATTTHQAAQIRHLIAYLNFGNIDDFRQMNIEWVKDGTSSKVDFMMGFVETYQDYLGQIGSWESYVQVIDPKMTALSVNLAKHAQAFEDKMPYGNFKKTFPKNYSPPALIAYFFQEIGSGRASGYNLPNFDDIRRDVGAKNVISLDLPGEDKDPERIKVRRELVSEFSMPELVEAQVEYKTKSKQAIVLLHEIIGHGSGTYDESKYGAKQDPIAALGSLGSALEEQRADLAALSFVTDPILTEVGFYKDEAEAKKIQRVMYDSYLTYFSFSVANDRSLNEAHLRGNWLLINRLLKSGVVVKASRTGAPLDDSNLVLKVADYEAFQRASLALLEELQSIKAHRDETKMKKLFADEAPLDAINEPWMKKFIERGVRLAAMAGEIDQPWSVNRDKIVTHGNPTLEGIAPFLLGP